MKLIMRIMMRFGMGLLLAAPIAMVSIDAFGISAPIVTGYVGGVSGKRGLQQRQRTQHQQGIKPMQRREQRYQSTSSTTSTSLNLLLDVPDGFFTITFPMLGILLSISKSYARVRMEERAWEQRIEDARMELLQSNPTLTELDLRRQEAAYEYSAYGVPRLEREQREREMKQREQRDDEDNDTIGRRKRRGVSVIDNWFTNKDEDDDDSFASSSGARTATSTSPTTMTEMEIRQFEQEYGIQYDPYYDEPYSETELPSDIKYSTDKLYGDRIYENGEIFYKDSNTGLYWRQGSKPRNYNTNSNNNVKFW